MKRVALVVGNGAYEPSVLSPLQNAASDALCFSHALKQIGFDTTTVIDVDAQTMKDEFEDFVDKVDDSCIAIFYFSGHGIEVSGSNYPLPILRKKLRSETALSDLRTLQQMQAMLETANPKLVIMIVDACREELSISNVVEKIRGDGNTRSLLRSRRGFAEQQGSMNFYLVFSCGAGQLAWDSPLDSSSSPHGSPPQQQLQYQQQQQQGEFKASPTPASAMPSAAKLGNNSPFTRALCSEIVKPHEDIVQVFREVRRRVIEVTKGAQVPWESNCLVERFTLVEVPKLPDVSHLQISQFSQGPALESLDSKIFGLLKLCVEEQENELPLLRALYVPLVCTRDSDQQQPQAPSPMFQQQQQSKSMRSLAGSNLSPQPPSRTNEPTSLDVESQVLAFLESEKRVLLLSGDSGSGKSTLCRILERTLWEKMEAVSDPKDSTVDVSCLPPVPLYIPLSAAANPRKGIIEDHLKERGWSAHEIEELRTTRRVVVFLDGFDEISETQNLYETNRLWMWKAHVVFTCRTEFLRRLGSGVSCTLCFVPKVDGRSRRDLFEHLSLQLFSSNQVSLYVEKYLATKQPPTATSRRPPWTKDNYLDKLSHLAGGNATATGNGHHTPFLLFVAMEVLPTLFAAPAGGAPSKPGQSRGSVDRSAGSGSRARTKSPVAEGVQPKVSRWTLCETFVNQWFERQFHKHSSRVSEPSASSPSASSPRDLMEDYWEYSCELAVAMFRQGKTEVEFRPARTSLFAASQDADAGSDVWSQFFGSNRSGALDRARKGCPLRVHPNHRYSFIHKSSQEYFVAKHIVNQIMRTVEIEGESFDPSPLFLNERLLSSEPSILSFLADRIRDDSWLQDIFLSTVQLSRPRPDIATAAANCASVLTSAGVRLSGLSWGGVRIPGADLSTANLEAADLTGADLSGVCLDNAFLRHAALDGATLTDVSLGQSGIFAHESGEHVLCAGMPQDDITDELLVPGHLVTVTNAGRLCIWDSYDVVLERVSSVELGDPRFCYLTANGRFLATSNGRLIHLFDVATARLLRTWEEPISERLFVTENGKHLVTIHKAAKLWDTSKAHSAKTLDAAKNAPCASVVCVGGGQFVALASGALHMAVRVYDMSSGSLSCNLHGHTKAVTCVGFLPDGALIVTASRDRTAKVWDRTGRLLRTLQGFDTPVTRVCVGAQSAFFVCGNSVQIWDYVSGIQLRVLEGHTAPISWASLSEESSTLTTASLDGTARQWNVASSSGDERSSFDRHSSKVVGVCISQDGRLVVSAGGADRTARVWDAATGTLLRTLADHVDRVSCVSISNDSMLIATGSKNVKVWDTQSGQLIKTLLEGYPSDTSPARLSLPVCSLALCPDSLTLISGDSEEIKIWDMGGLYMTGSVSVNFRHCALGRRKLVAACEDGKLRVYSVEHATVLATFNDADCTGEVGCVCIAPHERQVFSGGRDVRIWDIANPSPHAQPKVIAEHPHPITAMGISQDSQWLVTGSADKILRVFDLRTHCMAAQAMGHSAPITGLSTTFSDDGCLLIATSCEDKAVRLWKFDCHMSFGISLVWCSPQTAFFGEASFVGCLGISPANHAVLEYHGAFL